MYEVTGPGTAVIFHSLLSLSMLMYSPSRLDCGVKDIKLRSATAAPSRSLEPGELLDTAVLPLAFDC